MYIQDYYPSDIFARAIGLNKSRDAAKTGEQIKLGLGILGRRWHGITFLFWHFKGL